MQKIFHVLTAFLGVSMLLIAGPASAWVVEEDYENQSNGQACAPFWQDDSDSTVTNNMASSGSKSCKFAINAGGAEWGGGFGLPAKLHENDEAWVRFRIYMPSGFDYNSYSAGNHLKFIRWTVRGSDAGRLDWYWYPEGSVPSHAVILERDSGCGQNCWQKFGNASHTPVRGRWITYEMYVKFDHVAADDGGKAIVRTWIDGNLAGELTDRPTMFPGSDRINNILVFSYWNGYSPKTQHLYFDDLIATNEVPAATDSQGNPYIGTGNFVSIAPPSPPTLINVQ